MDVREIERYFLECLIKIFFSFFVKEGNIANREDAEKCRDLGKVKLFSLNDFVDSL
jgi:hypothetical protein